MAEIGAGPVGPWAAYQLRRRGWRVSVFEATAEPGGSMRHGILAYRLARATLDAEIARIVDLGRSALQRAADRPRAVRAAARGARRAVSSPPARRASDAAALDYRLPGVLDGAAYLAASNAGAPPALGPKVVVVGGGSSAAMDAARSARRAGHAVTVLALESRAQLPAQREEVEEALEEGIRLVDGAMITGLQADGGRLRLDCRRVNFIAGAVRGEFRVEPLPGSDFSLHADAVLSSIGQDPELAPFGDGLVRQGPLLGVDAATQRTSADAVWAGGDVASLGRFVTEAVGQGQRAAIEIHRHLLGADAAEEPPFSGAAVPLAAIATWYHEPAPRQTAPHRPTDERLRSGAEVQLGLELEQALAEGERCFSCGTCVVCDNCVVVCPDLAVRRVGDGYEVLTDYCKGCGLCVRECPTGSMAMVEERR